MSIDAFKTIEKGFTKFKFDPDKVKKIKDESNFLEWSNTKTISIFFEYQDEEFNKIVSDSRYHTSWSKSKVFMSDRENRLFVKEYQAFKLRKKKGFSDAKGIQYNTDKSIADAEKHISRFREKYNLKYAIEQFETLFNHFVEWYNEQEKKEVVKVFGKTSGYKFDKYEDIKQINEELKALNEKKKQLEEKLFDSKKQHVVKFLEKTDQCHEDFRGVLIESVKESKQPSTLPFC